MAPIPDDADLTFDRSDPEPTNLFPAPGDDIEPVLVELGTGVFAFTHPTPRYGLSNVGLVIDADGLTVIDTSGTPYRGRVIRSAIEALTAEIDAPLKRVVLTSSRVPFSGGSAPFWAAAFYGSRAASNELDQPMNLAAIRALLPDLAPAYHDTFETRPITHMVDDDVWLTPAAHALVRRGEASVNMVVATPGVGAAFCGALASFGVTPLAFVGDPLVWADTLDSLATIGTTIVPGHGPIGGTADLADQAAYLRACARANGNVDALLAGPWETWTNREFDVINVERAARLARGDQQVPSSMLELLGFG